MKTYLNSLIRSPFGSSAIDVEVGQAEDVVLGFRESENPYKEYHLTLIGEIPKVHSRGINKNTVTPLTQSYKSKSGWTSLCYFPYTDGRNVSIERRILRTARRLDQPCVFHRRLSDISPPVQEELKKILKPGHVLGSVIPLFCSDQYEVARDYGTHPSLFEKREDVVFHFHAPKEFLCKYHYFSGDIISTCSGVDFLVRRVWQGLSGQGALHVEAEFLKTDQFPTPTMKPGAQPFPVAYVLELYEMILIVIVGAISAYMIRSWTTEQSSLSFNDDWF